jgi:hypothetical protein
VIVFDRAFFDDLPHLLRRYRQRWDVPLCLRVVTREHEELLVSETLQIAERWIALVHFAETGPDAHCPEGERTDAALPVAVLDYADIQSVRLLPSGGNGARAFGFRT